MTTSPPRHPGPVDRRFAALWVLLASGAGAFSWYVARSELVAGEVVLTRRVSATLGSTEPLADVLDVAFTDASAPAIFLLLVPVVAAAWGRLATATYFVAGAATGLTKLADLVARPRPTDELDWGTARFGNGGYPSGHVVYVVLVFGTIAYLATVHCHSRRRRAAVVGACLALIALTGPARLVELDHWPADIVGGYLVAIPALMLVVRAHRLAPYVMVTRAPRAAAALHLPVPSSPAESTCESGDDGLDRRPRLVPE